MAKTEAALKRGEQAAVLYIDLDHFKAVNDTLGHAVGDEVIKQAAARLWGTTRETDLLARLGGDEFALLLRPIESGEAAARTADRIIKVMAAPMNIGGQQIEIGASVGIAVGPGDGTTTDQLVKNADLALYKAKSDGRSTYHFFEPDMDAELQQRRSIEAGLRLALQRDEMRLMFQPLLGLAEDRITCAEALLRWERDGRTISPTEFVPVAEETGLIVPIGEWVLNQACAAAAGWPGDIRVAVNLSPVQFRQKDLVGQVRAALERSGLDPTRLELEITESLLLADNEATIRALMRSGPWACASRWTISARAIPRSRICAPSPSTRSRSTARSCAISPPVPTARRSSRRSSGSGSRWACRPRWKGGNARTARHGARAGGVGSAGIPVLAALTPPVFATLLLKHRAQAPIDRKAS